ncbi:MAG: hypothetical protein CL843_19865 [Crocinitomicaceae bacterium]|nr:hypothetical protein [Crocinitomicaceae bacterium]
MPLKTARQIAEEALRKIGVYSINDREARPEHLQKALEWFAMILDEAGVFGLPFLRDETLDIPLVEGQTSYPLSDAVAAGVIFPLNAWLVHTSLGTVRGIDLLTREDWDREVTSEAQTDGEPCNLFVSQVGLRTLLIDHIPTETVASEYKIRLRAQCYVENGPEAEDGKYSQLPPMWNIWAIYSLARYLGDGTIKRLPAQTIAEFSRTAGSKFAAIEAAMQRNRSNRAPTASPHWM